MFENAKIDKNKIYCVIPAFNEESNIEKVVIKLMPYVNNIVVVDDGSTDKTAAAVAKHNVMVLSHILNRGQGAALKTGTEYAIRQGAEIIIHFDADDQFFAEDIPVVIRPIIEGKADMVFGSRFLYKQTNNLPLLKKYLIIPLARLANKLFLKVDLTDPQCGFRAITSKAAKKVDWQQDGMAHCSEILGAAVANNLVIKEVPIKVLYHNFGQRFSHGFKILKDLFLGRMIN